MKWASFWAISVAWHNSLGLNCIQLEILLGISTENMILTYFMFTFQFLKENADKEINKILNANLTWVDYIIYAL